jgi:hypothetical protein
MPDGELDYFRKEVLRAARSAASIRWTSSSYYKNGGILQADVLRDASPCDAA